MTRVAVVSLLLLTATLCLALADSDSAADAGVTKASQTARSRRRRCLGTVNCMNPAYYLHPCCQPQSFLYSPYPQPQPYPIPQPQPYPIPQPSPVIRCPRDTDCSQPGNAASPCCNQYPVPPPMPYLPPPPPPPQVLPYPIPQPQPPVMYPNAPPVNPCSQNVPCLPYYPPSPCCQPITYPPPTSPTPPPTSPPTSPPTPPPTSPTPPPTLPPPPPCTPVQPNCTMYPPYFPSPCCSPMPLPYPPPQVLPIIAPPRPAPWIPPTTPNVTVPDPENVTLPVPPVVLPWFPPPRPPMIYPPMPSRCGGYGPMPLPAPVSTCPYQANRRVRRLAQRRCYVDAHCPVGSMCCRSGCGGVRGSVCVPSSGGKPAPSYQRPDGVQVSVVFTSGSMQALWFLKAQVAPFVHTLPSLLDLELIPYGRVNEVGKCQYGDGDCMGNWLVLCAGRHLPRSPGAHLAFTTCLMNHTDLLQKDNFTAIMDAALQCAAEFPDKIADLYNCGIGEEGYQLFTDAGLRQRELVPELVEVPLATVNEVMVVKHGIEMGNFPDLLCRELWEEPSAQSYCQLIEDSRQEVETLE